MCGIKDTCIFSSYISQDLSSILSCILCFLADRNQQVVLDVETSFYAAVISGVPWGTVLRPLPILVYINDSPSRVSFLDRLIADYCLLYSVIPDQTDAESLQTGFNHLKMGKKSVDGM